MCPVPKKNNALLVAEGLMSIEEWEVISGALHKPAKRRDQTERKLVRIYYTLMKERSKSGMPRDEDKRLNEAFRQWLRDRGLAEKYSKARYREFAAEGRLH
jgi:hypothetical protein